MDERSPGFLSASELIRLHNNNDKSLPRKGLKEYFPREGDESVSYMLEERHQLLSEERVAQRCCISEALWDVDAKKAMVTKVRGKFINHMGHHINKRMLLHPEEALFLMETGNLEVTLSDVPLSIQEAYSLMLQSKDDIDKYHVYSHLSRMGYIVIRHVESQNRNQGNVTKDEEVKSELANSNNSLDNPSKDCSDLVGEASGAASTDIVKSEASKDTEKGTNIEIEVPETSNSNSSCSSRIFSKKKITVIDLTEENTAPLVQEEEIEVAEKEVIDLTAEDDNTSNHHSHSSASSSPVCSEDSDDVELILDTHDRDEFKPDFPDMAYKNVIKLFRPPSHLLPENVVFSQDVYIFDIFHHHLKQRYQTCKNSQFSTGEKKWHHKKTRWDSSGSDFVPLTTTEQVRTSGSNFTDSWRNNGGSDRYSSHNWRRMNDYNNYNHSRMPPSSSYSSYSRSDNYYQGSYSEASRREFGNERHHSWRMQETDKYRNEGSRTYGSMPYSDTHRPDWKSREISPESSQRWERFPSNVPDRPAPRESVIRLGNSQDKFRSSEMYQPYPGYSSADVEIIPPQHSQNQNAPSTSSSLPQHSHYDYKNGNRFSTHNPSFSERDTWSYPSTSSQRTCFSDGQDNSGPYQSRHNSIAWPVISNKRPNQNEELSRKKKRRWRWRHERINSEYVSLIPKVAVPLSGWKAYKKEILKNEVLSSSNGSLGRVLWTTDISPILKHVDSLTSEEVLSQLSVVKSMSHDEKCSRSEQSSRSRYHIAFDLYLPNTPYKKSAPPPPHYWLIITRSTDSLPRPEDLYNLRSSPSEDVPFLFAIIDSGEPLFFLFNDVNIPDLQPLL